MYFNNLQAYMLSLLMQASNPAYFNVPDLVKDQIP